MSAFVVCMQQSGFLVTIEAQYPIPVMERGKRDESICLSLMINQLID